jgi:hypothetical protein
MEACADTPVKPIQVQFVAFIVNPSVNHGNATSQIYLIQNDQVFAKSSIAFCKQPTVVNLAFYSQSALDIRGDII